MLGGLKVEGTWSVLVLDSFTTQMLSNVCGVSDLLDYGVSRTLLLRFSVAVAVLCLMMMMMKVCSCGGALGAGIYITVLYYS